MEIQEDKLTSVVGMRMVNFWCRLLLGKQTKLYCMMYKLMKVMHESDEISFRSKWITKVKGLLDMSGLVCLFFLFFLGWNKNM